MSVEWFAHSVNYMIGAAIAVAPIRLLRVLFTWSA